MNTSNKEKNITMMIETQLGAFNQNHVKHVSKPCEAYPDLYSEDNQDYMYIVNISWMSGGKDEYEFWTEKEAQKFYDQLTQN